MGDADRRGRDDKKYETQFRRSHWPCRAGRSECSPSYEISSQRERPFPQRCGSLSSFLASLPAVDRAADEFINRASLELRTPLTAILGYAEVLLHESAGLTDEQVKQIQAIQRNALRL